jgi:hypothetical protein
LINRRDWIDGLLAARAQGQAPSTQIVLVVVVG